jgi:hypothetical protein
MDTTKKIELDFDDLPLDVFEMAASNLTVESLTAGHGIPDTGASTSSGGQGSCSCSCSSNVEKC